MTADSRPTTIPAIWAKVSSLRAGAVAYRQSGESYTWDQVHRNALEFGAGLLALGIVRGDRVAIIAPNSVDWVSACVGIMVAGAVVVPVYPDLKPSEIAVQVVHAGCRFVVAAPTVIAAIGPLLEEVERFVALGGTPIAADARTNTFATVVAGATAESRFALAAASPAPEDLAAIIFTSGTTGGAKGVMLSHRNFVTNGFSVLGALDLSSADSVLVVLPLHHAMPLIATVVLVPLIGARAVLENDLRRIRDRLATEKPTIFFGVPALYEVMYRNILARAEAEGRLATLQRVQHLVLAIKRLTGINIAPLVFRPIQKALGGRLRFLVSGGAALRQETALNFFSLGLPLLQGWGMTEASPVVAIQRFSPKRFRFSRFYEKHVGSVGMAVPGVEVRLVDVPEKGIVVAETGEGEVLVRGANIFKGYWRSPNETVAAKSDEWLRTGDLARIDGEGNIYLTGRSKYIIVLDSGEKVYPDEVEDRLAASPLLADVYVTGRTVRDKSQVVAVVYPGPEETVARLSTTGVTTSEASIREVVEAEVARIGRELAGYKRVSQVVLRDTPLPRTVLQKVARGQVDLDAPFSFERWQNGVGIPT